MSNWLRNLMKKRIMWPIGALVVLIVMNTVSRPTFLKITVLDGRFYGSLIDILRNSAPLMLVSLGMCLVIATRGIDLSVGAQMAISGAVALTIIADSPTPDSLATVLRAILIGVLITLLFGIWNGFLVSVVGIQPIIATLVLLLAGRGIALWITGGFITTINSAPYKSISQGNVLGFPVMFLISLSAIIVVSLIVRRTALGVLTEAIGINPAASRLAGVRSRGIIWSLYGLSGLLAGLAGILYSSNIMAADANNAGLNIELDAILAVVLGGTSLAGGKFSLGGTVVGVFIIQTLVSTVTFLGVPSSSVPVFKAVVVILVVVSQAPMVRNWFRRIGPKLRNWLRREFRSSKTASPTATPVAMERTAA
jgi:ribose/xylose/arabinose/galactoside ABC-type transport system permease subunit